ncbi:MAG TPA: VacJ family lipoprotein [Burkholderiales bacterium]|nr:VacJ family lipoprotein [Burkholderiales bacterium]
MKRWATNLAIALLLSGAAGCATTTGSDPRDPLESFNRAAWEFNEGLDQDFGRPIARAYTEVFPAPVRTWVRNFFANVGDLWIGANNLLQGKPADALNDWARFAFNSTFGILGINDVASEMGLEKHDEDFGQTMGVWRVDDGAYHFIPILGSFTTRDLVGFVADVSFDPVWRWHPKGVRYGAVVLRYFSRRADLLDASRILEEAALDKYVFQRDAYLQRRRSLIYDGNPPRAEREVPRAEAEPQPQPQPSLAAPAAVEAPVAPTSLRAAPEAVEAAVQLLEAPVAPVASSGD